MQQAIDAALEARPRVGELVAAGSRGGVPARRGAAHDDVASDAQCRDDARVSRRRSIQAEIDSASELIDFWRFNPHFAQELYEEQPISSHAMWNSVEYRPLEGFVYAVTPFNFTSIAGNLPTAPALMGNTVIWKPASSAMLSAHYILKLLEAAGLPPGVINLVAGESGGDLERSCSTRPIWPAFTSPAAPLCSTRCGSASAKTSAAIAAIRGSSVRPAARTSSSRTRQPMCRSSRSRSFEAGSSIRDRSAPRPAAIYVPQSLWPEVQGSRGRDDARDQDGRRRRLPDVHGRRDRSQVVHEDQRLPGGCEEEREGDSGRRRQRRCWLLHRADADRDEAIPATGCCARRFSGPSSRHTPIRTRSGARRSRSWIARRRTR